jgi:beta-1,4-mannosyltransferase
MDNIYIYPKVEGADNPYIKNLEDSLSIQYEIINKNIIINGVLDLFRYILKTDVYFFNWIEDLAVRRYGSIQIIVFVLFLICAKCLRKKIVWTLHNKYTHYKIRSYRVDFMYSVMLKHSDLIFTHSQSGIDIIKEKNPSYAKKIKYLVHPIKPILPLLSHTDYIYDFLIWGDIHPYKGVVEFLRFLKETENIHLFKILIVGRCLNNHYKNELNKYLSLNIIHYDKFYEIEEIASFANQSRFTLFTFKPESFLSSGSLMESIRMGSAIIGPNIGAFKDLNSYSFIKTYNTYDEILEIYNNFDYSKSSIYTEAVKFCNENSWDLFGEKLLKELSKVL